MNLSLPTAAHTSAFRLVLQRQSVFQYAKSNIVVSLKFVNSHPTSSLLITRFLALGESHYDDLSLRVVNLISRQQQTVHLVRPRSSVANASCLLQPGKELTIKVDLQHWSSSRFQPGLYRVNGVYALNMNPVPDVTHPCENAKGINGYQETVAEVKRLGLVSEIQLISNPIVIVLL